MLGLGRLLGGARTGTLTVVDDCEVHGESLRLLRLEGPWNPAAVDRFRSAGCDGLEWHLGPRDTGQTADSLVDLVDVITYLDVVDEAGDLDPAAVARLTGLRLLALTRERDGVRARPDLSGLVALRTLELDDGPGLDVPALPLLERLRVDRFRGGRLSVLPLPRTVTDLSVSCVEPRPGRLDVDREGLSWLMVSNLRVDSLAELRAPDLEVLSVSFPTQDVELDLAPLARAPRLRFLRLQGPATVRGLDALAGLDHLETATFVDVAVPPDTVAAVPALTVTSSR
ncbi:hypothetical protein [Thalassiella azotivora]